MTRGNKHFGRSLVPAGIVLFMALFMGISATSFAAAQPRALHAVKKHKKKVLRGRRGPAGARGPAGPSGQNGSPGAVGPTGPQGSTGLTNVTTVVSAAFTNGAGNDTGAWATCAAGQRVLGGGVQNTSLDVRVSVNSSYPGKSPGSPVDDRWFVYVANQSTTTQYVYVYAICATTN